MRPGLRWVFFAVLLGAAGCDHASKQVAIAALQGAGPVAVAGGAVELQLTSNPGAVLSLGAELPEPLRHLLFLAVVPLLLLGACVHLLRRTPPTLVARVGLGLVAGGGLANWLDRLLHEGAVTDFVIVGLGPLRTGVFNVADVAIVAGVLLLVAFGAPAAERTPPPPE